MRRTPTRFYIEYGNEGAHAAMLRLGLSQMVEGFTAKICNVCHGTTRYEQRYINGCGHGSSKHVGPCEYCGETGLCQGSGMRNPAPLSVLYQVLNAGLAAHERETLGRLEIESKIHMSDNQATVLAMANGLTREDIEAVRL